MAQHGAAGWPMGSVSSGMDGANVNGNDVGFVGHVDHNTGSYIEGPASHENHYEHVGYAPTGNPYGQQSHGHYPNQHQYSNIGFGVEEGQPAFSHDMRTIGPTPLAGQSRSSDYQQPNGPYANGQNLNFRQFHTQELVGHYPEYAQPQQHVGSNDFQRTSWAEPMSQHSSSNPYAQGQQLYGNNAPLLRMATHSPAQSSTPKPDQNHSSYQVDPASSYQPQVYSGTYQTPQSTDALHNYPTQVPLSAALIQGKNNGTPTPSPGPAAASSHPVSWPSQGQAQRLGSASIPLAATRNTPPSVPRPPTADLSRAGPKLGPPTTSITSNDAAVVVPRIGKPGEGWKSIKGCPNIFVGTTPVRRQMVTNTPGVKPHVAGDNRNGTRLLPLLPDLLPCEALRERVRPLVSELKRVGQGIDGAKEQIKATSVGSEEHKRHVDDLKKLESRKASLESEKKRITGKAGALKLGKSRATGKSEAAEYDSESITESSEEEDPQELIVQQIMASETRPTDPDKGVEFDVVRIIRHEFSADQGIVSQGEKEDPWTKVIGRRVAGFGKYVVDLCAEAKALRERKASAPKSQSSQLQAAIDQKYHLVRVALETALEFGDEETLRNMGQHMKLMSGLTIALSRQFTNKTYNTNIPRTILRFISEATLMDLDVFQKVKLSTVLEKHGDNLDDEGKRLVAQISKNAEDRTAKNTAEKPAVSNQPKQKPIDNVKESQPTSTQRITTSTTKGSGIASKLQASQLFSTAVPELARKETKAYSGLVSARKVANGAGKAAAGPSPTKRPRDDDSDFRATKKVAVESSVGVTGTGRTVPGSISNPAALPNPTTNNGQLRSRPLGSTVLNKSRTAPKPPTKKPESQSSVSSTISGLLAEIAKPAEKPKPPERVVKAPETPEERARRLRKESRRGRTVAWKPDDELVQIRFFEHDSTEDEGRASNMIRDARDNRLEGQMLKQMQRSMQGEDDEDDGNPTETDIHPWATPRSLDFSHLGNTQRQKNYVTRGGIREIDSEQKKLMEEYENRELISIYTTLSEIPDTPKSPPRKTPEPIVQPRQAVLLANNPKNQEIQQRWSESRQFGTTSASQSALHRLGLLPNTNASSTSAYLGGARPSTGPSTAPSQPQLTPVVRMMTQEERDARILVLLQSEKARSYVDPNPYDPANRECIQAPETRDLQVQKAFSIIQNLVDQYKDAPTTSTAPSQGLHFAPSRIQDGYTGYSHGLAATAKGEEEYAPTQYGAPQTSHFATYQAQAQAQPQAQQNPQSYSQLAPQVPDQYAAILQQVQALQNPQAPQNAAVPQPTPAQPDNGLANLLATLGRSAQPAQTATQDPNYAAWQTWAQAQAQSHGAQSQAQTQSQSYPSYSQQYDDASRDEATYGSHKQDYQSQTGQSQGQYHRDGSERGNRKDFQRGTKDHKGINRALIGTKPCTFWAKGQCAKGDNCTFRHDSSDLK
ncbi:hypothetical protein E0Z10_g8768 [Xylaria hypoxylon]|uniref:C3H1-type domain-containing protein n=1 Tax=Xylaria hypoxylon TaxID=37992 RepID=A0A4Z0YIX1_9PEZI|nr:hypothetical protein E0Z10_g8768 [Xylaria hypoxylon]